MRPPLRGLLFKRALHTQNTPPARRIPIALYAAAGFASGATAYAAWQAWNGPRIRLDAADRRPRKSLSEKLNTLETTPSPDPPLQSVPEDVETDVDSPEEPGETEDSGSAAFNPETGEINWDCPCLGGMAHGPCGPQFREAFSCFVFSEEEPKGINCIEAFKAMQDCFREHPDVYGEEIMADEKDDVDTDQSTEGSPQMEQSTSTPESSKVEN
ncbi:hypothetical protein BD410DRAFT_784190 [Rickenella mellea]|uniref:Mitochondrial intermembrane space import and assembly protein 40 n=1 Tax=Rickenella mellea TaxID=50990 RepID=A0A4Y7QFL3_9AGAM|nr:hypothetical protein BD410DRAFT_784190 [Rickenella mellea]